MDALRNAPFFNIVFVINDLCPAEIPEYEGSGSNNQAGSRNDYFQSGSAVFT